MRKTGSKMLIISLMVVAVCLTFNSETFAQMSDIENHWAKKEIGILAEKGVLEGYSDGTFRPENHITKVEFYKTINALLGFDREIDVVYPDVKKNDWFYHEVRKGAAAGYLSLEGKINPNVPITREEAARIIGIAFGLENDGVEVAEGFVDGKEISQSAKGYVGVLKEKGYIEGYPDGSFKPRGNITRAEACKMIVNVSGNIVKTPGEYTQNVNGNMVVTVPGVVLKDMTIEGDLYISEGVSNGPIIIKNVNVKGEVYITAGEKNNITFENSSMKKVVVNREGSKLEFKKSKVNTLEICSKNVHIKYDGEVDKLIAKEDVNINDKLIEKGKDIKDALEEKVKDVEEKPSIPIIPTTPDTPTIPDTPDTPDIPTPEPDPDPTVEPQVKAIFHRSKLSSFGRVSIEEIKGVEGAYKFSIVFKYSDGETTDTVGPVEIDNGETTEIFYNGKYPVDIQIYDEAGKIIYTFKNITLKIKEWCE